MVTSTLVEVIKSPEMKQRLSRLNQYFYNRKHETQIRDEMSILINQLPDRQAMTEYPKSGVGAVDLTIYCTPKGGANIVGTVELKHQYPKDFRYMAVNNAILWDLTKVVAVPTSHFVLIVQQRTPKKTPTMADIKFMARDAPLENISHEIARLEALPDFSKNAVAKATVEVAVSGDVLDSHYVFIVYEIKHKG